MKKISIYELTICAILLSLLIVCAKISIPIGPIPITLQTFMVFTIPLLVERKLSFLILLSYILLGIIGLPVFSSGGGFAYVLLPSFGYILGFLFSSICIINSKSKLVMLASMVIALLCIYLFGSIYMYIILIQNQTVNFIYIIEIAVLPFILKDCISIFLAYAISVRLNPVLKCYRPQRFEHTKKEIKS